MGSVAVDRLPQADGDAAGQDDIPELVGISEYSTSTADTPVESDESSDAYGVISSPKVPEVVGTGASFKRYTDSERNTPRSSDNNTEQNSDEVHVRFGDIEWKEFGMILGDHPDPEGPAVSSDSL